MPDYPNEALKAEARGVVIAAVVFDENGDLSTVDVLEAPHPSIKQAITEALLQWKTGRYGTDSGPKRLVGWLSFECEIKDGVGHIGYTRRTDDDNQPDKRYRHPHVCCDPRTPFYYCYQGGRP
ncbi:MAG TPA: energy transducer TonB [Blastocatellia bacterium]|nr:energy transducer TonB [Blastocatellia bacterium]